MSVRLFIALILAIGVVVGCAAFTLSGGKLATVLCCCIVGIGAVRVTDVWLTYWKKTRNPHG